LRVCSSAQVYPLRFVERTVLRRQLRLGAVQQLFDGEYLNARKVLPPSWGVVEASTASSRMGLVGSLRVMKTPMAAFCKSWRHAARRSQG
jgi:hypothetical protein